MFSGGRYFYAVFMCHLAIEKALKGVYAKKAGKMPPKTHNLVTLLAASELQPEEAMGKFIAKLNAASVATRYPEHLEKLQQIYTKEVTLNILDKTGETVSWIKKML